MLTARGKRAVSLRPLPRNLKGTEIHVEKREMREPTKATDTATTISASAPAIAPHGHAAGGKASKVASPEDLARFELLRCAMYHEDCEAWFAFLHRASTGLNILLGTAAVATVINQSPAWAVASGVAIALLSVLSLVWDYAGRARDHKVLRQRYFHLMADLESGSATPERVKTGMAAIYADEPPTNTAVNTVAHNRAGRLMWGDGFDREPIRWLRRRLRHVFG
ncbi:hypothetical protein J2X53_002355 [Pseudorhodobacter sp. 4114]|nr:hypothetical protein [Pseudorhodobacter sp. 4114]